VTRARDEGSREVMKRVFEEMKNIEHASVVPRWSMICLANLNTNLKKK